MRFGEGLVHCDSGRPGRPRGDQPGGSGVPGRVRRDVGPCTKIQLGAWIWGGNNYDYFSGTIDNVRIYSRALSQTEISVSQNTPV